MSPFHCPLIQGKKQVAIRLDNKSLTYEMLNQRVQNTALYLVHQGIKKGSFVAFDGYSTLENVIFLFALFRIGSIACPLNFHLTDDQKKRQYHLLERVSYFSLAEIQKSITYNLSSDFETSWDMESPILLLFTSGSTSQPKAAILNLKACYSNALGVIDKLQLNETSHTLLSLPLFHVGGLAILFRTFFSKSTLVISSHTLEKILKDLPITHISMVPTQLFRALKQEKTAKLLSQSKSLLIGGAALSYPLFIEARRYHLPIHTTWGLTEMGSSVTIDTNPQRCSSVGKPLLHREIHISSDNTIWVRGETLFMGYYEKHIPLKPPLNSEGWLDTKDLGFLDKEGHLHFRGRRDLMFVCGGENIYPEEIEAKLKQLPPILEALVVPIPDAEWGFRPFAFVEVEKGGVLDEESIKAQLKEELSSLKIPLHIKEYTLTGYFLKPSRHFFKTLALEWVKSSQEVF